MMSSLKLTVDVERLEFLAPLRIACFVFEHQDAILVTLEGRGGYTPIRATAERSSGR